MEIDSLRMESEKSSNSMRDIINKQLTDARDRQNRIIDNYKEFVESLGSADIGFTAG